MAVLWDFEDQIYRPLSEHHESKTPCSNSQFPIEGLWRIFAYSNPVPACLDEQRLLSWDSLLCFHGFCHSGAFGALKRFLASRALVFSFNRSPFLGLTMFLSMDVGALFVKSFVQLERATPTCRISLLNKSTPNLSSFLLSRKCERATTTWVGG